MSGDRRGGRTSGNGDYPGSSWETVENKKKSWQAAGRGQQAQLSSSSNAPPTTARQAWNGNGSSRPWGNNRAQSSDHRPAARGNPRPTPQTKSRESELQALNLVVTPPLANGWQWASRSCPSDPESSKDDASSSGFNVETDNEDDDISDDDSDDDMSNEYDSDASAKSFGARKMNKWFKRFFEDLDNLTVDQIHEQSRHCPACKNGPGAIGWFKGLQSLVTHARTKGSKRVKLHRELAALLEEEMSRRGTSVVPSGEQFGKWKGLHESTESTDWEIVWPPMVIVMNTLLEKDDDDKWLGMGNQELFNYFSEYGETRARHAYGPSGHRGMSVLIFESSAVGYTEANRLHTHFVRQKTDREAWQRCKVLFLPGGKRQLYGFLAKKDDLETFNRHCKGKNRLKYEMRSHNEMVVIQMKQMSEDNQQLNYLKNKVVKKEQHSKAVTETACSLAQKLRETEEDNRLIRREAKEKHLEHMEELTSLEKFIEGNQENIYKAMELMGFGKLLQEERANARQCNVDSGSTENCRLREEQVQRFKDCQVTGLEEFEAERDKLIKAYTEKKMQLEKELDTALSRLMEKHKPGTFQSSSS